MASNIFYNLTDKAKQISNGIEALTEIWKYPQLLSIDREEKSNEDEIYVKEMWECINTTRESISECLKELNKMNETVKEVITESNDKCETLKSDIEKVKIIFAECGYHYEKDNDINKVNSNDEVTFNEKPTYNSTVVEFTPNLTWKSDRASQDKMTPLSSNNIEIVTDISTPVNKCLEPYLESDTPVAFKNYTPHRDIPMKPKFSKHLQNVKRL